VSLQPGATIITWHATIITWQELKERIFHFYYCGLIDADNGPWQQTDHGNRLRMECFICARVTFVASLLSQSSNIDGAILSTSKCK
jgi:hypothetical protein